MQNPTTLVINWHLTESCNYRCNYCYAIWNHQSRKDEKIHSSEQTTSLLSNLYQFFKPENLMNPLAGHMKWDSVRLNLAGGEPLLYKGKLPRLINQAHQQGFEVSLITNGSLLSADFLDLLAPQLTWLGISIDSMCPKINHTIGRVNRHNQQLDIKKLALNLANVRQCNPNLRIKINTVVNQVNHSEDLSPLIDLIAPDKWKILRMLPVVNHDLVISDEQFMSFVARHNAFNHIRCVEDNQNMLESYLMIDPHGRFFQNSTEKEGQGYVYSQPILEVGAEKAFSDIKFNTDLFSSRYQ